MTKIGSTIRERRDKKSWNQDGLARAANLSRKTVSDLENASRAYGIDSLIDSMLALEVDPWTFFGGPVRKRPTRRIEYEVLHEALDRILKTEREELIGTVSTFLARLSSSV